MGTAGSRENPWRENHAPFTTENTSAQHTLRCCYSRGPTWQETGPVPRIAPSVTCGALTLIVLLCRGVDCHSAGSGAGGGDYSVGEEAQDHPRKDADGDNLLHSAGAGNGE